ncbi:MAG: ThuA domain-containing protein [Planctomycetes bacterium]|nr:ThuA domain-containing protein [Planctomycetota bacterium]
MISFTTASSAVNLDAQLDAAQESYRAGDVDGALQELELLLKADGPDRFKVRVRQLAARVLHSRGEDHFRHARVAESIADFDRQLELQPDRAAEHWQRGIAYYYAGEYEKGARQFKLHETVNPQDVENAAWHFLCMVRAPGGSVEAGRKNLIPVAGDRRVPMSQIQQLFAGTMTPGEVLRAGEEAGGAAKFYADLYVGLYYEALGRDDESLRFLTLAAENPDAKNSYMGDVARVHLALRTKANPTTQARSQKTPSEKTRKILFLAGNPSHGYGAHDHWAGCKLLAKSLSDSGLPIETEVYRYGWPQDAKVFNGVDCVVIYADGGGGHIVNTHIAEMDALAKKGVGLVCLHYAVEVPKAPVGEKFLEWIGGYFETDWSVNPHWTAEFSNLPEHPITRGVKPFAINDEWYYHMRFRDGMRGVTPILTDLPPPDSLARADGSHSGNPHVRAAVARGEVQHMAWAVEREDGGRGFGFTGGHVHWNWADPNFRKLVLNAIAWCAKVEVPREGVGDQPKTLADMESNPDESVPADFDREAIRKKYRLPPDDAK